MAPPLACAKGGDYIAGREARLHESPTFTRSCLRLQLRNAQPSYSNAAMPDRSKNLRRRLSIHPASALAATRQYFQHGGLTRAPSPLPAAQASGNASEPETLRAENRIEHAKTELSEPNA
jgi:hypothetical protein